MCEHGQHRPCLVEAAEREQERGEDADVLVAVQQPGEKGDPNQRGERDLNYVAPGDPGTPVELARDP